MRGAGGGAGGSTTGWSVELRGVRAKCGRLGGVRAGGTGRAECVAKCGSLGGVRAGGTGRAECVAKCGRLRGVRAGGAGRAESG